MPSMKKLTTKVSAKSSSLWSTSNRMRSKKWSSRICSQKRNSLDSTVKNKQLCSCISTLSSLRQVHSRRVLTLRSLEKWEEPLLNLLSWSLYRFWTKRARSKSSNPKIWFKHRPWKINKLTIMLVETCKKNRGCIKNKWILLLNRRFRTKIINCKWWKAI